MRCIDRLSGEEFEAADEEEIRAYIAEGLNVGETVEYDVECDDGSFFAGEVTA